MADNNNIIPISPEERAVYAEAERNGDRIVNLKMLKQMMIVEMANPDVERFDYVKFAEKAQLSVGTIKKIASTATFKKEVEAFIRQEVVQDSETFMNFKRRLSEGVRDGKPWAMTMFAKLTGLMGDKGGRKKEEDNRSPEEVIHEMNKGEDHE